MAAYILVAFDKLDENNELLEIYCEATDLVKLTPIVADSCTELVQHNRSILEATPALVISLVTFLKMTFGRFTSLWMGS